MNILEEWRVIPGWDKYEASTLGNVRRIGSTDNLKPWKNRDRLQVELKQAPIDKKYMVHQLIVMTFIGQRPSLIHQIAHWDGNAHNNSLVNLRWATPKENAEDKKRHGTSAKGSENGNSKLTAKEVLTMRSLRLTTSLSAQKIGRVFKVSKKTVLDITKEKTWKHLLGAT